MSLRLVKSPEAPKMTIVWDIKAFLFR
jgi:hypothetical protein